MTAGAEPLVVWVDGALALGVRASAVAWGSPGQRGLPDSYRSEHREMS